MVKNIEVLKVLDNNRGKGKVFYCKYVGDDEYKRAIFIPINSEVILENNYFVLVKNNKRVKIPSSTEQIENLLNTPSILSKVIKKEKVVLFEISDVFFNTFNNMLIKSTFYNDEDSNPTLFVYSPSNFDFVIDNIKKSGVYQKYLKYYVTESRIPEEVYYFIYNNKKIPLIEYVDNYCNKIYPSTILLKTKNKKEIIKDVYFVYFKDPVIIRRHLYIGEEARIYDETWIKDDVLLNKIDLDNLYETSKTFKVFFREKIKKRQLTKDKILKILKEAIISFLYKYKDKRPYYTLNKKEFVEFIKDIVESVKSEKETKKELENKIDGLVELLYLKNSLKQYALLNKYYFGNFLEFKDKESCINYIESIKDDIHKEAKKEVKEGKIDSVYEFEKLVFVKINGIKYCVEFVIQPVVSERDDNGDSEYYGDVVKYAIYKVYPYVSLYSCLKIPFIHQKTGRDLELLEQAINFLKDKYNVKIEFDLDVDGGCITIIKDNKKTTFCVNYEDDPYVYEGFEESEVYFKLLDDINKVEKDFDEKTTIFTPYKIVPLETAMKLVKEKS